MAKSISVTRADLDSYCKSLSASAMQTQTQIAKLIHADPMHFLFRLKFEQIGCDPLNDERPLNLIEQLNQTFTYLASFKASKFLFEQHANVNQLILNLGTTGGSDIETTEEGGIAAEVFATVSPQNNRKLTVDIDKVLNVRDVKHRYVFFISPMCEVGLFKGKINAKGVTVWSLGCEL